VRSYTAGTLVARAPPAPFGQLGTDRRGKAQSGRRQQAADRSAALEVSSAASTLAGLPLLEGLTEPVGGTGLDAALCQQ